MIRILLLLLLAMAQPALAQDFPKLTGRVVDAANLLPPETEAQLIAKLEALQNDTTRQLVIATVPDLQGYDIAEYGYKLGDAWGIGQKGENNGIVMIVAPNERRARIEVGNGLGDVVPDVLASRIIRNDMTPAFKAGDFPGGIVAGTDAVINLIKLPPGEAAAQARSLQAQSQQSGGNNLGSVIFWLFIFFFFILPMLRSIFGKRGKRYRGPVIIWGPGDWGGGGGGSSWSGGGGFGGGFSGGGGSFGGGGASGGW